MLAKRRIAQLVPVGAILMLCGVGGALAFSSANGARPRAPAIGSMSPHLSAAARATFEVFAEPPGNSEDARIVEEVLHADKALTLDPGSVRLAQTADGIEVRVAGDSESVCLVGRIPGQAIWGGCAPESTAATPASPGIGTTGYPPGVPRRPGGELAVTAMFPNGTGEVEVASPGGAVEPVAVVHNTVAFIASEDATLSWTGPEGRRYSASLPH